MANTGLDKKGLELFFFFFFLPPNFNGHVFMQLLTNLDGTAFPTAFGNETNVACKLLNMVAVKLGIS